MPPYHPSVQLVVDISKPELHVSFESEVPEAQYDICDAKGRILRTGVLPAGNNSLHIGGLEPEPHILLMLIGNRVLCRNFKL